MNNKLNILKQQMYNIHDKIEPLKKAENRINKQFTLLMQEECKKNIGRCFKKVDNGKVVSYCKIINIDTVYTTLLDTTQFNPNQYPAIWFNYPYEPQNEDNDIPFKIENIFSYAWGEEIDIADKIKEITYEEISPKEYMEKFLEVNSKWSKEVIKL